MGKYNLPCPEAVFDIEYFRKNPKPFFQLAKELYPGAFIPTPSHYFVKLLNEKGLLLRHYTQVSEMIYVNTVIFFQIFLFFILIESESVLRFVFHLMFSFHIFFMVL